MVSGPSTVDDLLETVDHCVAGVSPAAATEWSAPVPGLDWDVRATFEHLIDVLGFYTLHLVSGSRQQLRIDVRCHARLPNDEMLQILVTEGRGLATAAQLLDPSTQVFHFHGTTDVSGIVALACGELLVHGDDAARGLGMTLRPRPDLAEKVLERLFPVAPRTTEPWSTLLWATGRGTLPGHPDVGPDWTYRTAPLS